MLQKNQVMQPLKHKQTSSKHKTNIIQTANKYHACFFNYKYLPVYTECCNIVCLKHTAHCALNTTVLLDNYSRPNDSWYSHCTLLHFGVPSICHSNSVSYPQYNKTKKMAFLFRTSSRQKPKAAM
mmetsp:Transcript_28154/g.44655  ORF Transcript_28154/g.44655 Transcript_28154/m.44655 type:complete len:125 (-) Transcript_28154:762-1136(-)